MVVTTDDDAVDDEAIVDRDAMDAIERRRADDGVAPPFDCLRDADEVADDDEPPDEEAPPAAPTDLDLERGDGLDATSCTTLSALESVFGGCDGCCCCC